MLGAGGCEEIVVAGGLRKLLVLQRQSAARGDVLNMPYCCIMAAHYSRESFQASGVRA